MTTWTLSKKPEVVVQRAGFSVGRHREYISWVISLVTLITQRQKVPFLDSLRYALTQALDCQTLAVERRLQISASEPSDLVARQQNPAVVIIVRVANHGSKHPLFSVTPMRSLLRHNSCPRQP